MAFLCVYNIGIGVGGGVGGALIDVASYKYMFLIMALANIVSIIVYFIFGRKHPSSMTYQIKK